MVDQMVLETQQWLNHTYGDDERFNRVIEDGQTGWSTINALIRALQIELGIQVTADNFGPGTESRFLVRYPSGIRQQADSDTTTSNVYSIIQGALWCKGYSTGSHITQHFHGGTGTAIIQLKADMGFGDGTTVDLEIMKALLSMKQFVLLADYGGRHQVRGIQQNINLDYRSYTGIIPTDGLYGREMNTALIQILQAIEGFTPEQATGNFGDGTRSRLRTIDSASAGSNPRWVWLASVALICNWYGDNPRSTWGDELAQATSMFQSAYALPVTGTVTPTTWMSLLTSKGDPDRPAIACDTRFEITSELLERLRQDGYQIVGRYLTEPNQDTTAPEDYYKAIRPGELERVTAGGMRFFPIYQEYSTALRHFTIEAAQRHARDAREAAQRLGIPPTYIYFAVDYDATDPEVTSTILPYFREVLSNLGGGYRVGIYAARNICTRVIEAGYAGSAFVSDMSTGFSGNLGFPIPTQWNYDQFTEIHGYGGPWDLDRVAHSGLHAPITYVQTVDAPGQTPNPSTAYTTLSPIDIIWHLEKRFEELRAQGKVGQDYVPNTQDGTGTWIRIDTWRCVLNYAAKDYLRDGGSGNSAQWALSAEAFRSADAETLENDATASQIIAALDRYISAWRQDMIDASGERVDLAHLAATTLGYTNWNLIPDAWTGWAGDLASAMKHIQSVMAWNPTADLHGVCDALVGQDDTYRSHAGLAGLILSQAGEAIANSCNRNDLCCDGDAIVLGPRLETGNAADTHLLSSTLRSYYCNHTELANRFRQIALSMGAADQSTAATAFNGEVNNPTRWHLRQLLAGDVSNDVALEACNALARFIY